MKFICARYIDGNRGDLLSRYGILSEFQKLGINKLTSVMCLKQEHLMQLNYDIFHYGKIFNTIPTIRGFLALIKSDYILWTGGLDLSDDSSMLKLIYIWVNFLVYRILGLKIMVLNQGAGPIKTKTGKFLVRKILQTVRVFNARDLPSMNLLQNINPRVKYFHSYDGIFAGDFIVKRSIDTFQWITKHEIQGQLIIGLNIREWFHFSHNVLPNFLKRTKANDASILEMQKFINAAINAVSLIRDKLNAKIILISAYEFGSSPSDDELKYLQTIKNSFLTDTNIQIVDFPITLQDYINMISEMDLMIGTRLHCSLTALRLGVPSINLNYTLKGRDIFNELGLAKYVLELPEFIQNPDLLIGKIELVLNEKTLKSKIRESVSIAIKKNKEVYYEIFSSL